jgi:hypothetical protein
MKKGKELVMYSDSRVGMPTDGMNSDSFKSNLAMVLPNKKRKPYNQSQLSVFGDTTGKGWNNGFKCRRWLGPKNGKVRLETYPRGRINVY